MTAPELVLWQKIRAGQLNGLKFRRQYSIGNYILDFYCPSLRLAVEIDGDSHYSENAIRNDKRRDEYIKASNIKVVRFTNEEIMINIEGVISRIIEISTSLIPPNLGGKIKI